MGIQINRIEKEYIFTYLENTKTPVSVHGYKKEALFSISSFKEDFLTLKKAEKTDFQFDKDEEVRIFFSFQNNYYTFDTKVKSQADGDLIIANPRLIYRDPQRRYERLHLQQVNIHFVLEGEKIELDFPKTNTFTMVEKPEYSSTFNPDSIVELITSFRNFVHGKASDHKIVMYREKAPQTFEEKLTIRTGKTLWIPSTEEDLPLHDPSFSGNIVVKKEAEDFLEESGTAKYLVRSELANLLYTKAKSNIVSEIYCPILYNEYAVGYIYTVNKRPNHKRLDKDFLNDVIQFSRVLSFSLEINGYYRQNRKIEVQHHAPVIDISAAGLLFATDEDEINTRLASFEDVDLNIEISGRPIVIGARIMRKFKDARSFYFGAQYLKINEDDFNFLFESLYGKAFDEKAERSWEGGVPPPAPPKD